jgi:Sulfatase
MALRGRNGRCYSAHPVYPQELLNVVVGPRNMVHSWATNVDDPTEMPRWGKIGKQRIEDAGPLCPKRMETVDDEIRDLAFKFLDKAKADGKPFFLWLNPTRMHIVTNPSSKYEAMRNSKNGWTIQEAGMAQTRRHRRSGHAEAKRYGCGRQYHCGFQHRQRDRALHLARRRNDTICPGKGHCAGRRVFVSLASFAGRARCQRGKLKMEFIFRARLVPDLSGGCRKSQHR